MSNDQNTDQSSVTETAEHRIAETLSQKFEEFIVSAFNEQDPRSSYYTYALNMTHEERGFLTRLIVGLAELSNGKAVCNMMDGPESFGRVSLDARFGLAIHLNLNSPGNDESFSVTQMIYLYGITRLIADGKMSLSSIEALNEGRLYPTPLGHVIDVSFCFPIRPSVTRVLFNTPIAAIHVHTWTAAFLFL